jgi:hypothetical protein
MNNEGWVRLHRKLTDNELWFLEPFTKGQAWVDLILNANHSTGKFSIRGNIILVNRGQIAWSELTMAKRWTWSRNKVRRFLKLLETEQQIAQQKNSLTTVITIKNYDQYQRNETTDDTAERQQKDSRRYTNNNDNNEKNDKNIKILAKPIDLKEKKEKLIEKLSIGISTNHQAQAFDYFNRLKIDVKKIQDESLKGRWIKLFKIGKQSKLQNSLSHFSDDQNYLIKTPDEKIKLFFWYYGNKT